MTEFYCVRHGKTEFNLDRRFQGRLDSPLLPQSIEDAKKVGLFLKDQGIEAAFCSPLKRAEDTAKYIISEFTPKISLTPLSDLIEMSFGTRDGMFIKDYADDEQMTNFWEHPEKYDPSSFDGETFPEVIKRATAALKEIFEQYPDGKVLVVAHAVVLTYVIKSLLGYEIKDIPEDGHGLVRNTSVSILETKDFEHFTCPMWNNTAFLK